MFINKILQEYLFSNKLLISFNLGCENCFQFSSVTTLDLSKNPTFGDKGLKNFLLSYKISNSFFYLRSLNLRNIGLDGNLKISNKTSGLYELCQFLLLSNCQITELDLSENHLLGDEGAKMIFTSLLTNNTLQKLNLAETKLSARNSSSHIATFLLHDKVFDLTLPYFIRMLPPHLNLYYVSLFHLSFNLGFDIIYFT